MPALTAAERDVLKASLSRFGMWDPIVVDQTGYVIDGHHRQQLASELGIDCPTRVWECRPEEREALTIEFNVARRQMPEKVWQEQVDYLRSLGKSDRSIARVLDVDKMRVNRYRNPHLSQSETPGDSAGNGQPSPRLGQDGKRYPAPGQESQRDVILRLLRGSTRGFTAEDLASDPGITGSKNDVARRMSDLVKQGLVKIEGSRNRAKVYRAVTQPQQQPKPTPPPPPPPTTAEQREQAKLESKADQLIAELGDPKIRAVVRGRLQGAKAEREIDSYLRKLQDLENQAQATADREAEKLHKAAINAIGFDGDYWKQLNQVLDLTARRLEMFSREFDQVQSAKGFELEGFDKGLKRLLNILGTLAQQTGISGRQKSISSDSVVVV